MAISHDESTLIREARRGNEGSLSLLTEQVCPILRQYVYRMTLNHDETDDIVQESLIDMAKCLGTLEDTDRFWPWLRQIALNKLKDSRRKEVRRRELSEKAYTGTQAEQAKGLANLVSEEVSEAVLQSVYELKPSHRRVLVLRCYEDMTFSQIAEAMDRSEFGCRMLFRRATSALKKRLARNGLGKGALLSALVLFGKLTSDAHAATGNVTLTAQSLKVGTAAATVAGLASLKGILTTVLVVMAALPAAFLHSPNSPKTASATSAGGSGTYAAVEHMPDSGEITEYWYCFPEGPEDSFLGRFTVRDRLTDHPVGQWLQNETGNYYYDGSGGGVVYLLNYRFFNRDLSTIRLPTDSQQLTDGLDAIEGTNTSHRGFLKLNGPGLLFVKKVDEEGQTNFQSGRHLNMVREECFTAPWPQNTRQVDLRDDLHKQGWAYFTLSGQINNKTVTGYGRIPFVRATYEQHFPWIYMNVADKEYYAEKKDYPLGIARPWEGLHTIDTIRRDTIEAGLWFKTQRKAESIIEIEVKDDRQIMLYSVHLERDIVEQVLYVDHGGMIEGKIVFDYTNSLNAVMGSQLRHRIEDKRIDWTSIGD